jgi:small subunit ribosomal protein S4
MKRQRKTYGKPLRPWDKERMKTERALLKRFGLRRKKEVWKAEAVLRKFRRMAREVSTTENKEEAEILVRKMIKLGLLSEGATLDDVLGLIMENILERRLQTIIKNKGLANTMKQARQLITHGHVRINGRKILYPSYIVTKAEENAIAIDVSIESKKPITKEEAKIIEGEMKNGSTE